ncbi:probable chitinase 10 [Battus philenor]|uniref:probable chitinase 10 n=1 Tax=Battus philenor TaxID=42288 RepID=UPI0035D07246
MGLNLILQGAVALLLVTKAAPSPRLEDESFMRSAVETIPEHDPIPRPIRASVESVPLRNRRDEGDMRLPLRDAVEKRPISVIDPVSLSKALGTAELLSESFGSVKEYYGAASYLNNGSRTDERLQQGNANLQEMQQTMGNPTTRRLVVCYLESWAAYRAPPLAYTAGLVPPSCTHLHYAFAVMHPHNYAVIPANEDYDVIKGGYRIATGLKRRIPGLRVLISIGGEGTGRLFSEMVQEPYRRNAFIESALTFLQEHDFDGIDLHWIYAGDRDENEKELLTTLLYELRERLSPYGYLLSTVLPPFRYQIEDGYDLSAVSGATDYTILQAWDMTHGKRDEPPTRALQHSALHRDPGASSRNQRYDNIEFMVKYILRHGMAADKLVLGIPLYGRSYTLAASTLPAPGAATSGWGDEGPYTQTRGMLAYFEICMAQREGKGTSGLDESGNSFAVFGNQWVTYDTPDTILEKMKFVISLNLAGAAAWAIDMDDFRGLCGSPYPIMSAISTTLNGESTLTDQSSLKIGSCETELPYLASDEESCAHFHFCTGGINYRMVCEDERLYDPSTGFCGHQDVTKCIPGQSLRISVEDAARFLSQAYETDFEWSKDGLSHKEVEQIMEMPQSEIKKSRDNSKRVVCYMTSWAFYRRGEGKFVPEHIDTRLCTHVVYAYSSLLTDDLVIKEFDPWADITNNLYERVTSLQDVTVLLGLGGWTDSAGDKYSRLVSSSAARTKFVVKAVSFLKAHNFKGLHLDWNYPVCWQSNCKKGAKSDKQNFAKLVQELSKALHAADMELGVALSGYREVIEAAYDLPVISKAADFMSTMTYDYHGGWERTTAHHTPLVPAQRDALAYYSIEYAIKAMIDGGADPKKLLLGLAFYGQSYRLADVEGSTSPGAPAAGPGEPGEFTKQPGMLSYYEICYRVKNLRWKTGKQDRAGPYAYSNNQWVGFDDPKSIREKVEWALGLGLGGVTAWAIDLDDFNNRCCMEPSPLLRAAGRALGRNVPAPPKSSCDRPPEPVTPAPPTTTPAESDGSIGATSEHVHHHDHTTKPTSTTWPSWNPPSTTAMTWWPQATTTPARPTTTKTTTTRTTTTRRSTTRPPTTTTTTTQAPEMDTGVEGADCEAGEYRSAPGDCEAYLQCEGGQWRKHRCAPGLHWSAKTGRCDWPSFAKCTEKPPSQATTATTTLAPITSRPPPTTTTRRTTTSRRTTTTRTTTTTTTTTTTPRPKPTTTTTTTPASTDTDGVAPGLPCSGQEYEPAPNDCNSYLHCDGTVWRLQSCAPGLHWSAKQKHCDWPKYAKCEGSTQKTTTVPPKTTRAPKPTRPPTTTTTSNLEHREDMLCSDKEMYAPATTCDAYLLCISGRWHKQRCPSGLHWDKRTNRCDWKDFAMCEAAKPTTTKRPVYQITTTTMKTTTTRRPTTTTKKPYTVPEEIQKPSRCATGTYHTHPRCEKFYVCVNGILVTQSCAPGLVWNQERSQCDFPSHTSCTDRRKVTSAAMIDITKLTTVNGLPDFEEIEESIYCENGQYDRVPTDCTRYRHCLFGKFEEFSCSAGLHWNQDKQICDWPKYAKCKTKKVTTTTTQAPLMDPVITVSAIKPEVPIKPIESSPTSVAILDPITKPQLLNSRYKLVCYYTNWSWYRPGLGKYGPEDIDPTLCTHIVFGFAVLGPDGLLTPHDPWADQENHLYERVIEFKKYGIKVSIAIGGWNDSIGDKYSKLVNDPASRRRFVSHAVEFIERYGFDGLDLDWEYPKCWQVDCSMGPDSDKEGFADLVRELSAVFKPKGLILSSAVSPSKRVIDEAYDVPVLARHLDWIAVMTYDYHGQWDKKTGHVAPLYYHPDDDNTYFNANYTMHYWMEKGSPSHKLVMGMPMYGQTFTTSSSYDINSLNVPAVSGGDAGEYTRAKGFLAYYEICERIKNRRWKVVKDPLQRMGPFAYKGNQWVSFDDVDIIKKKVNFIKSLNLAGGMVWALDLDDFKNRCNQGPYPLLNAIKKEFLAPNTDFEQIQPITETSNQIDEDLEDIEVRPSFTKPKPTTTPRPIKETTPYTTTNKPIPPVMDEEEQYKVICYFTNWAYYRPGSGKYTPNDIDPSQCTHIVYAFAVLDSDKLEIKPHDNWLDVENKFFEKVVELKNQGVKVLIGLGGWKDSAGDKYSRLVNSPAARRKFVVHVIDFIEQYEFDGLDLDWNYPTCWQVDCNKGPSSDKEGFAKLVTELRSAFVPKGLLLSAAVSGNKEVIDAGYDIPVLGKQLDWISLMSYDYHGQWEKKTGHVAPMYSGSEHDDERFSVNFTVNYWINKGAPREKLIVGIPFYGQTFSLSNVDDNGLGSPANAGGDPGDETRARGFLAFYEICGHIRTGGWDIVQDPAGRMGPYATRGDQWVSFDDDNMVRHKAQYVNAMGLGGTMVWTLDLDDFTGEYCGCGKSPLLANINSVLRGHEEPPACSLEEIAPPPTTALPDTTITETVTSAMTTEVTTASTTLQSETEYPATETGLVGKACSGISFKADEHDCSKYYLCLNGEYIDLSCPAPLVWNKNHCDWPAKTRCKGKPNLKITEAETEDKPIIACYFSNWAYYRPGKGKFGPEQVDASLCTHIVYAWAHLSNTFKLVPGIPELDVDNDFLGKISELRLDGVKVILGVGGLKNSHEMSWSKMASSRENRNTFIESALTFLKKWKFDGLHVAWQYPVCENELCVDVTHRTEDRNNFNALLSELSKTFRQHNFELSAAVSPNLQVAALAYDPEVLTATLDWMAIAANDYYGSTKKRTEYLLPLKGSQATENSDYKSILAYWSGVVPVRQLVMSVPAYGRSYTLRSELFGHPGAPSAGPGDPGNYTQVRGFLAYYEICSGIKSQYWEEVATEEGTCAVHRSQWVSYLRPQEVFQIISTSSRLGLRGAALWALDLDDWRSECSCEPWPLLTALRQGVFEPDISPTLC